MSVRPTGFAECVIHAVRVNSPTHVRTRWRPFTLTGDVAQGYGSLCSGWVNHDLHVGWMLRCVGECLLDFIEGVGRTHESIKVYLPGGD